MVTFRALLVLIAGLLDIVFSLLVLTRDTRKLSNRSFFALAFSMGGWAVGIGFFLLTKQPALAFTWAKVYYFFPLAVTASLMVFTISFPYNSMKRSAYGWIFSGFLIQAIPLVVFHTYLTERLVYHSWGKQIVLNPVHYSIYSVYLLVGFPLALIIMYRKSRQLSGLYGVQAIFFFVGFLIAAIFGVLFNLALPAFGNYRYIWAGPLFTTAFIVSIAISIVRHKMFDIRPVVARAFGYASSLSVIAALYGFIVFGTANLLFGLHLSVIGQVSLSAATGLAALSFQRVKSFFDRLTETLFYRDAYNVQDLFDSLNRAIVSTLNLEKLLHDTTAIIAANLKSEYCLVGLRENEAHSVRIVGTQKVAISPPDIALARKLTVKYHHAVIATDYLEMPADNELQTLLQRNNIAVLVRLAPNLKQTESGLGYLVLGPKKSGNPYTQQDFRVLDTLAKELIIAIQNALHFEEIQNFNETLQQKVVEATNKLRRTNEKLKEMDETKDDFISMASHQLRTPLTSVKGYLSMVLEGDAGDINKVQREMLGQAFFSSQRMVYLIADLLNVSRLKTGKFIMEPSRINLAEMVEQEMSQLNETAAAKALVLAYDKPYKFPDMMLDETKTRQVIMNFMDNAIYYTPTGGHITIDLIDKPKTVELRVTDNGIGVPKAEQYHLFTKFYRAANARKTRPDGTGLGLFMAKKVITAQSGSVIFESQEGKGSTFGFSFSKATLASDKPADT